MGIDLLLADFKTKPHQVKTHITALLHNNRDNHRGRIQSPGIAEEKESACRVLKNEWQAQQCRLKPFI